MISLVIVLSAVLSSLIATADPTDCSTSECPDADANVLIQKRVHVESGLEGVIASQNADDLLKDVESMMFAKDPPKRDMSQLHFIKKIVNKTLLPGVLSAHAFAQDQFDQLEKNYDGCADAADTGKELIEEMLNGTKTAEGTHSTCRTEEDKMKTTMEEKCKDLDDFLKNLKYPTQPVGKTLEENAPYLYEHFLLYNRLKELNHSCNVSTEAYNEKQKACDDEQATFEGDFCQYRTKVIDTNLSAEACYGEFSVNLNTLKLKSDQEVPKWKAEYNSIQKILCYLDVWLGDNNTATVHKGKPASCQKTVFKADILNISDHQLSEREKPFVDMSPVQEYPGSSGFVSDRYADLPSYNPNLKKCLTHTTTTTTTTAPFFEEPDYDSGWFAVVKNQNYDKSHDLGVQPTFAMIWAASDCSGANMYKMDGIYSGGGYGAWLQRISKSGYRVSTGPYSAMSGYGVENHWTWDDGSGCIRVLMWGGAKTPLPAPQVDSGWFPVVKNSNYDKSHNLGDDVPALAIVWAAADCTGKDMNLMDGIYSANGYGSWLQRITKSGYRVSTGPASAMSGYGVDNHWAWDDGSGCIRVLMWGAKSLPAPQVDSGWFPVVKNTNYDKSDTLPVLPTLAIMWAASDCNAQHLHLMDPIYSGAGYGAWLQRIKIGGYRVSTGPYSSMSGYGVDNHWAWDDGSGCVRVLMWH